MDMLHLAGCSFSSPLLYISLWWLLLVFWSSCIEDNFLNHLMGHSRRVQVWFGVICTSLSMIGKKLKLFSVCLLESTVLCCRISIVAAISSLDHILERAYFINKMQDTCSHSFLVYFQTCFNVIDTSSHHGVII